MNPLPEAESPWPPGYVPDGDGNPVTFHLGQKLAFESIQRIVAMLAGTQGGKTGFGPVWLDAEIRRRGNGDYIAVTATYDLFKLKMLPAMLHMFEGVTGTGRYWAGDRIIELKDPVTGTFLAKRGTDPMWGRIILRSADALAGLESATAKGAWLDEAGQVGFGVAAWRAIRRRLALNRGRILITTTLYDVGWIDDEVIDRAEIGGEKSVHIIGEGELEHTVNEKRSIDLIQFDSIINPAYPLEEYYEAKETMPEDEFAMFYRGRKAKLRTAIYDCFDTQAHTCPRFEIPAHWPRYLGVDFGGINTVGIFFAENPDDSTLFGYRLYKGEGGELSVQHAYKLMRNEPRRPVCYGGAGGEDQWRSEVSVGDIYVRKPRIQDKWLGIAVVYSEQARGKIIYFDHLQPIIDEKRKYRRAKNKDGTIAANRIENEGAFHYLDAERYIVSSIRSLSRSTSSPNSISGLQTLENYINPYE